MSKVSSITVLGGSTVQATVVRDPSRSPFVLRSVEIIDDGTGQNMNDLRIVNVYAGGDNPDNFSHITTRINPEGEETARWIIKVWNGVEGEAYRTLDYYVGAPAGMTSFSIFFAVPDEMFAAAADRSFTVTVGLSKPSHFAAFMNVDESGQPGGPDIVRYVTGRITIDSFGAPTLTWTQL